MHEVRSSETLFFCTMSFNSGVAIDSQRKHTPHPQIHQQAALKYAVVLDQFKAVTTQQATW